jgi:uncharacterized integral membrane protein
MHMTPGDPGSAQRGIHPLSTSAKIKFGIGFAVLFIVILVGIQNSKPIDLRFLFWRAQVDGLLLFALLFAAGLGTGFLLARRRSQP